jgi:hypothetical protein
LTLKSADNIGYPDIPWIAGKPNATVNTADAIYVAGGGQRLQHFRHMVSGDSKLIGDRRSAEDRRIAFSEKNEGPESEVCEIGHAHDGSG